MIFSNILHTEGDPKLGEACTPVYRLLAIDRGSNHMFVDYLSKE